MSSAPQVTCSKCGATMLASTAARTGGLCMACKQGIRQTLEAAKAHYKQQRQPDPFRDHWTKLVHRVSDAPDGFYRLSEYEQTYFLACVLEGEVYNGGMYQFFSNSSGDYYGQTLEVLQELGAFRCHALLKAAAQILFPHAEPPHDQAARWTAMRRYREVPELERIDREFGGDPDKLNERLRKYALDHELVKI